MDFHVLLEYHKAIDIFMELVIGLVTVWAIRNKLTHLVAARARHRK
jgi:hypothetical protein